MPHRLSLFDWTREIVVRRQNTLRWELDDEPPYEYAQREGLVNLVGKTSGSSNGIYTTVDPTNLLPYEPEWDDLVRLHKLARRRKVMNVLEFGCGHSSLVFADALEKNHRDFGEFVRKNLRRSEPFRVDVVDDYKLFLDFTKSRVPKKLAQIVRFHFSPVEMTEFQQRICTRYLQLPNVCPDLIYLDGPSQHSVLGDVSGITTASPDRLPMASDLLRIEHFLLPGTLIVVDGRTANARFLAANFQRDWSFSEDLENDVHYFELTETPLGPYNQRQIDFCLDGHLASTIH